MPNQEGYQKGFPYHRRFGALRGQNQNCAGICLYGDVNAGVYYGDEHPEDAGYADHQKVSLWVEFERYRPYGIVEDLLRKSFEIFSPHGWKWAQGIDALPMSSSGVDDLVDTQMDQRFLGIDYLGVSFPPVHDNQGYNAARGFRLRIEKPGTAPEFSLEEVLALLQGMTDVMKLVFWKELPFVFLEGETKVENLIVPPADVLATDKNGTMLILLCAQNYIEQKYPEASQSKNTAFANSVQYLVTGWSGGFGGPSLREHAASYAVAHRGSLENGLYAFDEAVKILEHPDGVIFGPIQEVHRVCYQNEHCFDDDPEDLKILGGK